MFQKSVCLFSVWNMSLKKKKIVPYKSYLENLGSLRNLSFLIGIYKKSITLIFITYIKHFPFLPHLRKDCVHIALKETTSSTGSKILLPVFHSLQG